MKYLISLSLAILITGCATPQDVPIDSLYDYEAIAFEDQRERTFETARWIAVSGAMGALIGFLAFVFVPSSITPKWVSAVSIPMSIGVAVSGQRLLEWLGSEWAEWMIAGSAGFVVVNGLAYFSYKLWCRAKNNLPWSKTPVE
jgi:hypothetical protein